MADLHVPDDGKPMSKVIWLVTMSLDAFMAGLNDSIDWVFEYGMERPAWTE